MDKPLKIGWRIGAHNWAFRNLASHIKQALPDIGHMDNVTGDIEIFMDIKQFRKIEPKPNYILHLDGNRWYEN